MVVVGMGQYNRPEIAALRLMDCTENVIRSTLRSSIHKYASAISINEIIGCFSKAKGMNIWHTLTYHASASCKTAKNN